MSSRPVAAFLCLALLGCLGLVALGACGGAGRSSSPAADGVRAYAAALRRDDPRAAYALLSEDTRKHLSFDEFALQWKDAGPERAWQATALDEGLRGEPNVGERAQLGLRDGGLVPLEREGNAWRLGVALVTRTRAEKPRDAIRLFSEAVAARNLEAVLGVLTTRRREGLSKQIAGFLKGLDKHVTDRIDHFNDDRAIMTWDEGGIEYKLTLLREDAEWRIDDISVRPAPPRDGQEAKPPPEND